MTQADKREQEWKRLLTTEQDGLETRILRRLPSDPRCLLCHAPYGKPWGPILGRAAWGRSARYPQLCNACFRHMEKHSGGAEVTLTVLFADVRGSTRIAEQASAEEFRAVLETFYGLVTEAVSAERGIIDKFLGDGVMALFIPSFAEVMDAAHGLEAARRIQRGADLPVGIGVNTGPAFTGFLGPTAEVASFTAVGDAVNVAHRLGEGAAAGEVLAAAATLEAAGRSVRGAERRELQVKGREQPVIAWSLH